MKLLLLTTVALMAAPINSVGAHNKHLGRNTKIGAKSPNVYSIDTSQSYVIPSGKLRKLNDISNCLEWKCEQWCALYTPEMDSKYIKYGCIDDGDYCDCE